MISSSQTQYKHYEAVLGDIVTKLMPGRVPSAGTACGAKQLVFPDVDFSPYSL